MTRRRLSNGEPDEYVPPSAIYRGDKLSDDPIMDYELRSMMERCAADLRFLKRRVATLPDGKVENHMNLSESMRDVIQSAVFILQAASQVASLQKYDKERGSDHETD